MGINYFSLDSSGLSDDEYRRKLIQLGQLKYKEFRENLDVFIEISELFDPVLLLSIISFYGNTSLNAEIEFESTELTSKRPTSLLQAHIEIAQALLLTRHTNEYLSKSPILEDLEFFANRLSDMTESHMISGYKEFSEQKTKIEGVRLLISELQKGRTQVVRNWGYKFQIRGIANGVFTPFSQNFIKVFGFAPMDVLIVLDELLNLVQDRVVRHCSKIQYTTEASSITDIEARYQESFPEIEAPIGWLSNFIKDVDVQEKDEMNMAKSLVIEHSNLHISSLFTLDLDTVFKRFDIPFSELSNIMDFLSYSFGDLKNRNKEHFFLDNPIWTKPLIKQGPKEYFMPNYKMGLGFPMETIEKIISQNEALKNQYFDKGHRGTHLENATRELFKKYYEDAKIEPSLKVKSSEDGREKGECDILVIAGRIGVVIECKSRKMHDSSKRGSHSKLKRDFEDLINKASKQIDDFIDFMDNRPDGLYLYQESTKQKITIDSSLVRHWIRLAVSLESYGTIALNLKMLQDAGIVRTEAPLPAFISLPDLEIVMDLLGKEQFITHYLFRRPEFQAQNSVLGDEMDLLYLYTQNRFTLPYNTPTPSSFMTDNLGKEINKYYVNDTLIGPKGNRPKIELNSWWSEVLTRLSVVKTPGWRLISNYLLNAPIELQNDIHSAITQFWYGGTAVPKGQISVRSYSLKISNEPYVLLFCAHIGLNKKRRNDLLFDEICPKIYREHSTNKVVIIGKDLTLQSYPYDFITYAEHRPELS